LGAGRIQATTFPSALMSERDPAARARLIVPLPPAPEAPAGGLARTFDIVLG